MNRTQRSGLVVVLLVAALSGCITGGGPTEGSSTSATPTTAPTPSPTPTEDAQGAISSCEDLFADEQDAALAAEGYEPSEGQFSSVELERIVASGGTVCAWAKPASDGFIVVGQLLTTQDAWDEWRTELESFGWTAMDEPLPDTLWSDWDAIGYRYGMLYRDGVLYFAVGADVLGWVVALQ